MARLTTSRGTLEPRLTFRRHYRRRLGLRTRSSCRTSAFSCLTAGTAHRRPRRRPARNVTRQGPGARRHSRARRLSRTRHRVIDPPGTPQTTVAATNTESRKPGSSGHTSEGEPTVCWGSTDLTPLTTPEGQSVCSCLAAYSRHLLRGQPGFASSPPLRSRKRSLRPRRARFAEPFGQGASRF